MPIDPCANEIGILDREPFGNRRERRRACGQVQRRDGVRLGEALPRRDGGRTDHRLGAGAHEPPARGEPVVVGLTLDILLVDLTSFLAAELDPEKRKASETTIPLLSDIPLTGAARFDRSWRFYLTSPLVPLCGWLVFRTCRGLGLRSAGENPQGADVSGIHVNARRGSYTAGMGGAYLILASVGRFEDSIVGGRGFIALIALIAVTVGGWTRRGTIAGCLLFGVVLSFRLSLPGLGYELNGDFLAWLPFVVTILAMSFFAQRVRPPAVLAQSSVRGLQ
jgi:simple sugar transport system permease protein